MITFLNTQQQELRGQLPSRCLRPRKVDKIVYKLCRFWVAVCLFFFFLVKLPSKHYSSFPHGNTHAHMQIHPDTGPLEGVLVPPRAHLAGSHTPVHVAQTWCMAVVVCRAVAGGCSTACWKMFYSSGEQYVVTMCSISQHIKIYCGLPALSIHCTL